MTRRLAAILLLALLARCAGLVLLDALHFPPSEDHSIAINITEGRGFSFVAHGYTGPTSIRPPVYPMMLAGLYTVLGINQTAQSAALVLNVLASAGSVALAFGISRKLGLSDRAAAGCAMLLAVWPTQIVAVGYLQGLALATFLLLAAIDLALRRELQFAPLAGLCAGFAVLTESILLLPVVATIVWLAGKRPTHALLITLGAATLVTPWLYRNAVVQGRVIGITSEVWSDVYAGNGDRATGSIHLKIRRFDGTPMTRLDMLTPVERDQLKQQPEAYRNQLLRKWSIEWIRRHPIEYLKLCVFRVAKTLWLDWDHPLAWRWINVVSRSVALIGCLAAFGRGSRLPFLLVIFLCIAAGLTLAEARNAAFMDVAQLLALASLADRKSVE